MITQRFHAGLIVLALAGSSSIANRPAFGFIDLHRPFDAAATVPADVSLYVHVLDAKSIREELADRPIAAWINSLTADGDFGDASALLARSLNVEQSELFDRLLGRRFTLIKRGESEWALTTDITGVRAGNLLQQLRVRIHDPKFGFAVSELPEQQVLIAVDGGELVVGPTAHPKLFMDQLALRSGRDRATNLRTLELRNCAELGPGRVGIYVRHDGLMGGASTIVADLDGDRVKLRHAAKFESAPFTHSVTNLTCDFSPVLAFEQTALAAFIQPTDIGDGPVETFLTASLSESLVSPAMRANMGSRRLTVLGEEEGKQLERPVDVLTTTFVTCLELKDPAKGVAELDQQMTKVTARLNQLADGTFLFEAPNVGRMKNREVREVDLSEASNWIGGGFPIMKNVSLAWTVAEGSPGGAAWFVVGSHRRSVDDVVKTLGQPAESCELMKGKFDSCGVGNGIRIGRHVSSWLDRAEDFAEAADVPAFNDSITLMSQLAGGLDTWRWQLARPSQNEMRLDVQIKLADRESAGE